MSEKFGIFSRRPLLTVALGSVALAVGVGAVHAQMGQGGWRGPHGGMNRGGGMAHFCAQDSARYQPVVRAYIKADLNLKDKQVTEFDRLADLVGPAMVELKKEACTNIDKKDITAPEKLEKMSALLRKAAEISEKALEPTRSFYATLDDTQKARFNQLMERHRGPHRHGDMMPPPAMQDMGQMPGMYQMFGWHQSQRGREGRGGMENMQHGPRNAPNDPGLPPPLQPQR